jgi:hypothetical protein
MRVSESSVPNLSRPARLDPHTLHAILSLNVFATALTSLGPRCHAMHLQLGFS